MMISASIILAILCSSASSTSGRLVRIVNRDGEDSLESVRGNDNNEPDVLIPSPRLHVLHTSASIASPFGSSLDHTGDAALSDSTSPFLSLPDVGTLRLFGLDPSVPLTKGESAFLEETIRDTLNKIHQDHGIDQIVHSVVVNNDAVAVSDIVFDLKHNGGNSNNRSLLRGSHNIP